MKSKTVEVLLTMRESRDHMPEVALLEKLLIEWEDGQWKVTNPDGHSSWVGRSEYHQGAVLNYLKSRLSVDSEVKMDRPSIVCLCGSTRFSEAFHLANLQETLAGNIVLTIGCDFKSDTDLLLAGELTQEDKQRLDELHLRKIDLADEVLILNVNGYIGESTRREIAYAETHNKQIRYLEHKMSS